MDAVKFLKEYKRMCGHDNGTCHECPIGKLRNKHCIEVCDDVFIYLHPFEVVSAVEEWSEEHPN